MADTRISALSVAGPLTGAEVLPLVQGGSTLQVAMSVIATFATSALTDTVALETGNRISADNVLSAAINTVSNAVSLVSVVAANALSVANAASNKASVLSVNLASVDARVTSVLSVDISNVRSAILANSAQMTSADDAISNAVSLVSVVAANALSIANAASNKASVLSVNLASVDARVTSVLSVDISNLRSAINVVSNAVSIVSVATAAQVDIVSNYASVVSNYASLVSQYASVVSNYASIVSNYTSIVSNYVSIVSVKVANVPTIVNKIVSNVQSTQASALVNISGLSLALSAGETWEVRGMLLMSTSAATVGVKVGVSTNVLSDPRYMEFFRLGNQQSAGMIGGAGQLPVSAQSTLLSLANTSATNVPFAIYYRGVFNVASAGTFQLMYCGILSTAASPIHILPGSYMTALKLK